MRASICASSTAAALHRVFIAPIEQSHHQFLQRTSLLPRSTSIHPPILLTPQRRTLVNLHRAEKSRLPRDDEIKSWSVQLVTEDGKLQEPRSTMAILDSMDRKKDSLVIVKEGEPGIPPICKIMNKVAMRESEKARRKAEKKGGVTVKTMELNWAIDNNDLGHRLTKLKEFLGKGQRVEVLLASKRKGKGRKATEEEAMRVIGKIRGAMREMEGAKEMKPMEGKILGTATLFLEGKVQKESREKAVEVPEQAARAS
ncbi:related to translation initiation factor IF-3 [Phialocephala subalpina]|uniref:Related to translation initiation factor IF-3 n=1 Tax=Phialocephala subalpina TaxID=576137 RepID=A0A1L7WWY1_9HELO|nr:related to translation initiation factor IF-3 [Phialocephala subalpina]